MRISSVVLVSLSLFCGFVAAQDNINVKRAETLAEEVGGQGLLKPEENQEKWDTVASQVKAKGGCDPNVCFALDGSASIPAKDYATQVNFVQLIAAIVGADPRAAFAAAQYGRELEIIRRLTTNAVSFVLDVDQSTFLRAPATFIEPGVLYCTTELGKVQGEPAKVVLFGDGRSDYKDIAFASAAASDFKKASNANEICAVGVGFDDKSALTQIVGRADRVLTVKDWPEVLNILDDLVEEICGKLPPPPSPSPSPKPTGPCPCKCQEASGPGAKAERKVFKAVRKACRPFKPRCSPVLCSGFSLPAFQCC